MSAPAAAPVLALLPPGDPPPRPVHPQPAALDHGALQLKVRRATTAACVAGALLPVAFVAAGPYVGDAVFVGLVLCWALVIPGCGLALLLSAAVGRTPNDLRALLAAFLSLALGLALVRPAARAGMEAWVASHGAELDALAAERAKLLRTEGVKGPDGNTTRAAAANAYALLQMGLPFSSEVSGGLRFSTNAPFAPDLLYADGGGDPGKGCVRLRVTPLGGRWFLYECSDPAEYHDM